MTKRNGNNFRQSRVVNQMRRSDERRYMLEQIRREQKAAEKAAEKPASSND